MGMFDTPPNVFEQIGQWGNELSNLQAIQGQSEFIAQQQRSRVLEADYRASVERTHLDSLFTGGIW